MSRWTDPPPPPAAMPSALKRTRRGGSLRTSFALALQTTTPILGGAPKTRTIDTIDVIRERTIRGHLRFWWRALRAGAAPSGPDLYREESALWGKAADESGGHSEVTVSVEVIRRGQTNDTDINGNDPSAYALWPARAQGEGTEAERQPAKRWNPGVRFRLTVSLPKDSGIETEVRNAVRAWILFGGYGSRWRRGVGSLTVDPANGAWLPDDEDDEEIGGDAIREALTDCFGARDVFAPGPAPSTFPSLAGAVVMVGQGVHRDALRAWLEAVGWLRNFRQGVDPGRGAGLYARDACRDPGRPGQSRWPEADKLRHVTTRCGHAPRYDAEPAWPRAEFGLPIVGKFTAAGPGEPPPFVLGWQDGGGEVRDRLASPVIVKALPTRAGFRASMIWLARTHPPGKVVATFPKTKVPVPPPAATAAAFGYLGSPTDAATAAHLRAPLAGKRSVKAAFLDWLSLGPTLKVAP